MSCHRLRATASRLRAAPDVVLMQCPTRHASSGYAITRQINSPLSNRHKLQTRSLSASTRSPADVSQAETTVKKDPKLSTIEPYSTWKEMRQLSKSKPDDIPTHVSTNSTTLFLNFGDKQPKSISKLWLRDACACPSCVNPSSGQKTFATTDIPLNQEVKECGINAEGELQVTWRNDLDNGQDHESVYPKKFLAEIIYAVRPPPPKLPRVTWDKSQLEQSMNTITYADWMSGGEAFAQAFSDLIRFGIIFLRDVDLVETSVEEIAKQIGHLQSTFYGMTWDVISKPQAENVAYTNVFLGLHHDLMYWNDVPKIQILHCLENSCDGGDSIFSDGLRAAKQIQAQDSDHFELLSKRRVPYHYDIPPHKYRYDRTVFKVSGAGDIRDIYWSPPFQAPFFSLDQREPANRYGNEKDRTRWHTAAKSFKDSIEAPENVFQYKMRPGDCVLFDNRRVFHGRREFDTSSGKRWLKGGYVSREVLRSKFLSLVEAGQIPTDKLPVKLERPRKIE